MFFWNSLAFLLIQQMLAIWSLVPLPFLKPAQTSESSQFTYCWSLTWRILSITLLVCEMSATVQYICKYMCVCIYIYIYTLVFAHNLKKDLKDLEKECSLWLVKNMFLEELERLKSWKAKDLQLPLSSSTFTWN